MYQKNYQWRYVPCETLNPIYFSILVGIFICVVTDVINHSKRIFTMIQISQMARNRKVGFYLTRRGAMYPKNYTWPYVPKSTRKCKVSENWYANYLLLRRVLYCPLVGVERLDSCGTDLYTNTVLYLANSMVNYSMYSTIL